MPRRLAALVALLAVLVTPLGALWCAYTCAADDGDAAPARANAAIATGAVVSAHAATVAAHDECAADLTNRSLRAVIEERVHTDLVVEGRWTVPASASIARGPVGPPLGWADRPESPPGRRASTVRRV
jgi:hypothetical protein